MPGKYFFCFIDVCDEISYINQRIEIMPEFTRKVYEILIKTNLVFTLLLKSKLTLPLETDDNNVDIKKCYYKIKLKIHDKENKDQTEAREIKKRTRLQSKLNLLP